MSLKQTIKIKICLVNMMPNYPLADFVIWAEDLDKRQLLTYLDEIQQELDEEQGQLRELPFDRIPCYTVLHSSWCLYCAQIRAYYRAIVHDPECEKDLIFLLF